MKHKELKNHIEDSFLKMQHLEVFLVQSAYIKGLLKLYINKLNASFNASINSCAKVLVSNEKKLVWQQ